jgi:hypothetical protein
VVSKFALLSNGSTCTFYTEAKHGVEVFHLFNSKAGTEQFAQAFVPDSPLFAGEKRYAGPFQQIVWKIEDDIIFK